MAWPLIAVGAALMAGSAIGASSEESGDILKLKYPEPSSEEKLASKALLDIATKLYEDSNGSDPEFYKTVFEGLPETKMGEDDRQRLAKTYSQINMLANQKAIEQAGQAFGENMDSLVARGVMSPVQADKQKIKNEAEVRAMMNVLNKRWQATEIADARKMWLGDQKSQAATVGLISNVRAKNQAMFNQTVDMGLKSALRRAGAVQDFQSKQMWANEKVLQESRAAEYDFWGKMVFPGGGGGGGNRWSKPSEAGGSYSTDPGSSNFSNPYGQYSYSSGNYGSSGFSNSYYPASGGMSSYTFGNASY